ncbi:MAG TPA: hypothetical protein VJS91_00165 [Nitrososphaeraceae archaeon]|nr:hypothetical protein [Nitrososphaeraceae archaeon]
MINHQNFSTAYPATNRVSFDESSKFSTTPVKGILGDFETSFITTNPNNEKWKNKLCENTNQAGINIGIPSICDSSDRTGQNGNNYQQNQDISDRLNETVGSLKEKLDDSIFGNKGNDNSQSNDLRSNTEDENNKNGKGNNNKNGKGNNNDGNDKNSQNGDDNNDGNSDKENKFSEQQLLDQQGEDKAKSELDDDNSNGNNGNNQRNTNNGNNGNNGYNGDSQGNNNDDGLGIAGLDLGLNVDEKLGDVDEKIDNLKNNLGVGQQQEKKDKEKNNNNQEKKDKKKDNNNQGNNDGTLGINGLAPNIHNIQANLEKQIEKLKDKFENERDNQRLIEQRNEFDDDDDDDADDGDDDSDDGDGKDYDSYGFNGDDDSGNGNKNGEENFNFAAAGDFGCSTNTQNTIENMQSKDPEIVLTLGDHSYHSTADCWFDMMSPVKDKLMLTLGHHDVEDGQAKMNQYMNSFALDKPFYSYDYNKVHFLVMSAKSVYYKGSEQYNFVLEDLKKASENENVNWIVVSSYGPPYTSPSEHTAFKQLREVYHPIFEQYGVDLVLSAHNHNYQRTYPLTYNPNDSGEPTVTNTAATDYDGQKDGIVFAIVGTGGVNFYSFNGQAPFVDTQFANKFGFLNIDISNGNPETKLTGTFYDNKGGQILDQFTIEKDPNNKNTEVINS